MICLRCGCRVFYSGRGRPPKYCKRCAKEVNKYKEMMRLRRKRSLGGSFLWEHRFKDFDRESEAVKKERQRIGI